MKAAVAIPTQRRAPYLEVALASIVPQAHAAGAEVLVVDDGPDEATRGAAERHGARYLPHAAPRGLNAARNTALQATDAQLVCFVDDDVEVRPGWLDALLAAATACPDEVAVLTGPIRARFEDHRFRTCGREGPPITFLDLGPADRDCDHAWGANMAVRRSAIERAGRFDEARELYGDEQEWQARVKAAGGRIRYVAGAALDHRRAGDDARLLSLCRAAYRRGLASRRFDVFKGTAPSLASEVRVLAGCVLHGPRRACMNGPVLAAHSLGRLRAALATPTGAGPAEDFLSGTSGTVGGRRGALLRARDAWLDVREAPRRARLRRAARREPPRRRVLAVGDRAPRLAHGRRARGARAQPPRGRRRHRAAGRAREVREPQRAAGRRIRRRPTTGCSSSTTTSRCRAASWTRFLCAAERTGLKLAQPAHRLHSHAAWPVTRRHPRATARETTFVEIGPVTAFHRDCLRRAAALPRGPADGLGTGRPLGRRRAPSTAGRSGSSTPRRSATPNDPAGSGYARDAAEAQARAFLAERPYVRRDEVRTLAVHR